MQKNRIDISITRHASALPLALLLLYVGTGMAAEAPITPGSVLDSLGAPPLRMPSTPPQVVLPVQAAPSQHEQRARRFRVNAFEMSGNTVFKQRSLKRLLERFVDQELNLYDLNKAADAITTFYHDHGYTLARAVIPAQRVADGIVKIQIIEGRIGIVSLNGNQRYSSAFIQARTHLLQRGTLVTTDKLETTLLLLNDLPGLNAKAILQPGSEFGETDAEIDMTEQLFNGSATLSNHGRKETGQNKLDLALSINAPFGWGDQLTLNGSSTDHKLVRHWKVAYSFPLNTLGTRLALSASKVEYEVGGEVAQLLGINGDVKTKELQLIHPLSRTRNNSHTLALGIKRNELTQNVLNMVMSNDSINLFSATYLINHIHDDASVTNAAFSVSSNFKSLKTVDQQDAVLGRYEIDVNHTAPLSPRWDMFLRGQMVYSKDQLPDSEKFSLGGPASVRGYRPSEVRGDSGYLATVEVRRPFSVGGNMSVFRLSADTGQVTYRRQGFRDSWDNLHSIGMGIIFYPAKNFVASIDAAKAVRNRFPTSDGKGHRIWMTLSANF